MTLKEKYDMDNPDHGRKFPFYGCPDKYASKPDYCGTKDCCIKCWNREMPEENPNLNQPRILDSGNRREFESGAVRDIQEGKGRCDLLPLDVVGDIYDVLHIADRHENEVFADIATFMYTGHIYKLFEALRDSQLFDDPQTMLLEVAKHFEEGCKKYGENNWQKGIPTHCYIDSAVRHYLKYLRGDKDEPHDRAFCWNILCCIWTCKHKPELNDYAPKEKNDEQD